jgi:hypothetical protein
MTEDRISAGHCATEGRNPLQELLRYVYAFHFNPHFLTEIQRRDQVISSQGVIHSQNVDENKTHSKGGRCATGFTKVKTFHRHRPRIRPNPRSKFNIGYQSEHYQPSHRDQDSDLQASGAHHLNLSGSRVQGVIPNSQILLWREALLESVYLAGTKELEVPTSS